LFYLLKIDNAKFNANISANFVEKSNVVLLRSPDFGLLIPSKFYIE